MKYLVALGRAKRAMNTSVNRVAKQMIGGFSWVLMMCGATAFFVGGRTLLQFAGIDGANAQLLGMAGATILVALGYVLRTVSCVARRSRKE